MLQIYFGNIPEAIYNTEVYFQNVYEDEWIVDDFVTRENLFQIPYSVNSILELRKTTSRFKHTYNRTYPVIEKIRSKMDYKKKM